MNTTPKVIDSVVNNNLCIGCGMCVYKCPSNALEMQWNEHGFLIPKVIENCDLNGDCSDVCPFNPFPKDEVKSEDELAKICLPNSTQFHKKIGKFERIYAGYSNEFRLSSSSGGLATYICAELLEKKHVDHIFSIKEASKPGTHYEYAISSSKSDLLIASKTRYFPVTLATVLSEIDNLEGTVAIVGIGCFIKAIRLAQHSEPKLKEKIPFLIGIICGGVKSSFFTEYLASKMDIEASNIQKPQFRKKDITSTANDYSFSCSDADNEEKSIKMRIVGDMWGTGLFKANACDFCDDVTTELADISLGDAWLDPYYKDGKGTNVVVTRSLVAENLIKEGIRNNDLAMDLLPLENFLASQQGSFNHRHNGMAARIEIAKNNKQLVPPKRYEQEKLTIDFKLVQKQRMQVRARSLAIWKKNPDAKSFDKQMEKPLDRLKFLTKIYHKRRRFTHLKNRLIEEIGKRIFSKNKMK
ncbi:MULTISPECIES: Coenzyme F420 hydrogenase/dehydrogenase, beta subunit C-terminal domain [Flavobacteriaceae]|uniref:4Fe-4S dicluster domain-containing protein n=2 Tax=Flavobacteriaceae TaxID=49546 RepID=A0A4Y8AUS9_9FLAO|nr:MULTISPECIES: Coenzyme F420 hydrogenase/dehydrogenase, beta subunit C-terminal domain [Flavobacteriaceae]TEW75233.1 4Fe-4S dicluster domain-containing protein [Gramella jeungdoensis]GGK60398.1 coenzyme F420 hydrogenase [Lutibacter litoralis]